jgi:hypothetical protein
METKQWRITLRKGGEPVTLYASTTDAMIRLDLGGESPKSLILMARQFHRHPPTHDQNHRDLAIGAIMTYAHSAPYDRAGAHVELTHSVPTGEATAYIGGDRHSRLVPVWEEPDPRA